MRQITSCAALFFVAAITTSTTACGPIYSTEYTFVPPANESGRACTFQCQTNQYQCQQLEDMRNDRCEDRAEREYQRCQDRGEKYCYEESCSSDYTLCESQYRSCYQACGGQVQAHKVCTAFCDQR